VELYGDKPRVINDFDNLYKRVVGTGARAFQSVSRKLLPKGAVEFEAMTMTFGNNL